MKQYADPAFVPRRTCYRCFRPEGLCYCDELRPVDNRTRVIVVQHPREQFHPLNTARIAEHSLRSSVVIRQRPSQVSAALLRAGVSSEAAILFPSADAEQLETLAPERYPKEIIVVDGTWSNAKTLLRDVPELARYRRLKFTPSQPSAYRIRKEPRADYLSTIESVAYVLRHLEPETEGIQHLEETFSRMIDRNIEARRPSDNGSRFQRKRRELSHRFPEELAARPSNFVVAYCEGTSLFARGPSDSSVSRNLRTQKEPLVVYLKRLGNGEILRLVLRTERQPPERLLGHLALSAQELDEHGVSRSDAKERIRRWLRDDHVYVVWNPSSLQILRELGLETKPSLILKGTFCDYVSYLSKRADGQFTKSEGWGGMEEFITLLDLPPVAGAGEGRGALRLAQTEALLRWILPRSQADCATGLG